LSAFIEFPSGCGSRAKVTAREPLTGTATEAGDARPVATDAVLDGSDHQGRQADGSAMFTASYHYFTMQLNANRS
jgi:hypothetical protein